MTPRDADPLDVTPRSLASQTHGYRPAVSYRLAGLLLAALSGALVAGALMFFVGRATAGQRGTPQQVPAEAFLPVSPSGAAGTPSSPPVTDTGIAQVGDAPDPTSPPVQAIERGTATWCAPTPTRCQSWGGTAKLGAVPSFRWGDDPYRVKVCNRAGACVTVTVVSYCGCPGDRIIDLSPYAFGKLAPLSRGVIPVTVEDLRGGPSVTVPPTDR